MLLLNLTHIYQLLNEKNEEERRLAQPHNYQCLKQGKK